MEIWGGMECTLNRVHGRFIDQFSRSGHSERRGDLALIGQLGVRKLRYPIHWERVQPEPRPVYDWSFPAREMEELSNLGVEPIVGLLHHGSGPAWTGLLDPDFPKRLADYALAVARRFPEVRDYTPVNEPLTTARFSALYGHWHPHRADDRSFTRALLNQIEGTMRAMESIRSIRPDARLVQTEDIAKVFSTPKLAYQAEFENQRRWVTFDMLAGRFNERHPLWDFLLACSGRERQMQFIAEAGRGPDLLGINYYLTSERWLDENLALHPPESHGGNGRDTYADVAAVRGCSERMSGMANIVREVWERYRRPIAITECHLGCTREEQLRWLMEAWHAGGGLRREGVDVRAITAWALLGAFDWNSLVTTEAGVYEPGAFDVRSATPRPTQIAKAIASLARTGTYGHPVLAEQGWWHRGTKTGRTELAPRGAPIMILGGAGNLGRVLKRLCLQRGLSCRNLSRHEADVCDVKSLRRAVELHRPWAVINASGYTLIDDAESDRDRCFEINERGAFNAASVCAATGLPCVTISTDLVFDGGKEEAYLESDATLPLNVYGASKQSGEQAVHGIHPQALVIRTSPLFDPWSVGHFPGQVLLQGDSPLILPAGRISPTYSVDLCHALLDLLIDGESGLWHLANVGSVNWSEFAELLFDAFELPTRSLRGEATLAPRPQQGVLTSEKGSLMPSLEDALPRFAQEFQPLMRCGLEARRSLMVR